MRGITMRGILQKAKRKVTQR